MTNFIKRKISLLLAVLLVFNGVPLNVAAEGAEESTETGTEISTEAPVEISSEAPENSAEVEESPEVKESAEAAGGVAAESAEEETGESVTEESVKETSGETPESEEVPKETAEETLKETSKDAAVEETKTTVEEQEVKEPVLDANEDGTDSEYPESPHPYGNNMDETYTYTKPGATKLAVCFSEDTYTESGWDYIYLYDKDGNELGKYSGNELSGNAIGVPGDTIKIRLVTDSSVTEYGFSIDSIIAISEGKVISIEITTLPDRMEYYIGEKPDLSGMMVLAEFETGESCVIPGGLLTVEEYDFSTVGETVVTVQYGGCTAEYTVTVLEYPESRHPYDNNTDETYTYTKPGATKLSVSFSEDTYTESGCDFIYLYDKYGDQLGRYSGDELSGRTIGVYGDTIKIRLTSDGETTGFGFSIDSISEIPEEKVTSLEITKLPDRVEYGTDEQPDLTGMEVTAEFETGESCVIPDCFLFVDRYDFSTPGKKNVSVQYDGYSVMYTVTVFEATSIDITALPDQLEYFINGEFDLTGMEVTAEFGKDTNYIVPNEKITIDPYDFSSPGEETIIVRYRNCTTQLIVTVIDSKSGTCGDTLTWVLASDGVLTISGNGEMDNWSYDNNAPWYSIKEAIFKVIIEDGVTSIGNDAFYKCGNLSVIEIPSGITQIGYSAFYGCSNLQNIELPLGVSEIGIYAFSGCSSLKSIVIPEGIISLNGSIFAQCSNLQTIDIPSTVTEIGNWAFESCSSLTEINLPQGITIIGYSAFYNCSNLQTISLPDTITEIGEGVFCNCKKLESVLNLPEGMTEIPSSVFQNCEKLTKIHIPSGVTRIGNWAFKGCSSLADFEMPDQLTSIGEDAFSGCSSLTVIDIPKTVEAIGEGAFVGCRQLKEFRVDKDNFAYCSVDGVLYTKDRSNLITYPNQKGSVFTIPDTVTEISYAAFLACDNLVKVEIPETVVTLGSGVFQKCSSLKEAELPETMDSTGYYTFADCDSLTDVRLHSGITTITSCSFKNSRGLEEITIPENVSVVGMSAFRGCSGLKRIVFTGNAPEFPETEKDFYTIFRGVTADAYYPAGNETWGQSVFQNYGGELTWIPDSEVVSISPNIVDFCVGDRLTAASLSLEAVFKNGKRGIVPYDSVIIDEHDFSTPGEKVVTIHCGEYTTQLSLNVWNTESVEIPISEYPESSHPYNNNMDEMYIYTYPGALKLSVNFSEKTYLTYGDMIYFYDTNGIELGQYQYDELAGVQINVAGDTIKIRLITGDYGTDYGFSIDSIVAYVKSVPELKITSQPSDYTGKAGDTASFTVEASGENLSYQWQYQNAGTSIWKTSGQSGNKTKTLKVPITEARDGQKYRCVITDGSGKQVISNAAALHVEKQAEELQITSQPVDYTGEVGETAVFRVTAAGSNLSYQWQYQNAGSSVWKASGQNGNKTNTLSVPITAARDGQKYRCVITDGAGNQVTSNAAALHVGSTSGSEAVTITSQPVDYTGEIGETAVFRVTAVGEGLSYQWQYQNAGSSVWKASGQSGNKTNTLSVPITAARNGQKYRCVITDGAGNQAASGAAALHVGSTSGSEAVTITSQPSDYTGEVGETAVFRVTAAGENLSYQWEYQNVGSSTWKASGQSGNKTNTLSVPITVARDGQKYRCVITDGAGNQAASGAAALHVGSTSGSEEITITSQPADYTGKVGETAVFRVTAAGESLSYQWEYQNAGSSVWKASGQSGNKTNTLSVPITAARNGQKYRCVVTDGKGNSVTSDSAVLNVNQ